MMFLLETAIQDEPERICFVVNQDFEMMPYNDYLKGIRSFSVDSKLVAFQQITRYSNIYMDEFYHIMPNRMLDQNFLYKNKRSKFYIIEERKGYKNLWFTLRPVAFSLLKEERK